MDGDFSMQLIDDEEEIDRSQKQFALLDTAMFKQENDSEKISQQIE